MLGIGRPFILEFVNPKKVLTCKDEMLNLQKYITSDLVYCHDLKIVDRAFFDELKEIENSKAKSYCCVVWVKKRITKRECDKLNTYSNIQIKQKTPVRVLHRRS